MIPRLKSTIVIRIPLNLLLSGKTLSSLNISEMQIGQIYQYILKNALGNPSEIKSAALKKYHSQYR